MEGHANFSDADARAIGERIGIDWNTSRFDVEQFRMGLGLSSSTAVAIPLRT